jgi:hypothetical protein
VNQSIGSFEPFIVVEYELECRVFEPVEAVEPVEP